MSRTHLNTAGSTCSLTSRIAQVDPKWRCFLQKLARQRKRAVFTGKRSVFDFCDVQGAFPRCYGVFCVFSLSVLRHVHLRPTVILRVDAHSVSGSRKCHVPSCHRATNRMIVPSTQNTQKKKKLKREPERGNYSTFLN